MSENYTIQITLNGVVSYFVEGGVVSPLVTTEDIKEASKYSAELLSIIKVFVKKKYPTAKIDIINL